MYALAHRGINKLLRKTATHFSFGMYKVDGVSLVTFYASFFCSASCVWTLRLKFLSMAVWAKAASYTGPNYTIPDELGQQHGSNLFHSFGAFNVHTGESATFTGPDSVTNIISRVTGGNPSSIDGVLHSDMTGANLYLLNPQGVILGPNATLDISRSVHISTADVLRFADRNSYCGSSRVR